MHSKYAEFSVKCINYNAELLKKKNIANKKAKGRLHHRKMTEAHVLHSTFFFPWICSARACVPVCECVREFSFLSIVSLFFIRPNHLRVLFLHFTLFFFFCRISSLPHTPPHTGERVLRRTTVTMSVPFSYFALALTTFLLLSIHFFLLCTNQSASECMCLCVRAVSLFSILFSWLYCLRFVLFRFFFSLFWFLVRAFEQCEYCII